MIERPRPQPVAAPTLPPLSPKDLARLIGVSESSMKRWIDDGRLIAIRTSGGHRRVNVDEALRFIRTNGFKVSDPRPLGLVPLAADVRPLADQLYDQLYQGRTVAVRSLLCSAWAGGATIAELGDGPIRAAMTRLGDLWRHDEHGIAIEHQATDTLIHTLSVLRGMLGEPGPEAPLALGGAPVKDPYLVPSILAGLVLQENGWRTMNLGPETPIEAFKSALARHQPRVMWLAVSTVESVPGLRNQLNKLTDELLKQQIHLLVGGRISGDLHLEERPNRLVVNTLAEAVAFARGLHQPVVQARLSELT
jgi:excisionase family DNA binding protein